MSHPTAQVTSPNGAAVMSRPGTLTVTLGLAVLTAVVSIIDQILFLTGGRDAAVSVLGDLADLANELGAGSMIDDAVSTLNTRAYVAIVLAVLLLVFGVLAGRVWANVLTTIVAAVAIVVGLIQLIDVGTGAMNGLAGLTSLLAIATLVMVWMPANRRYVKAKQAA
ncbi:hypothetical protein [Amycolatopsis taiwanensis]|uniref:Uncharacterized protein n=1 Tax=Amycolatopsis taiwanensis TaxID=342230 RepID=A0A9W6VFG0_9PSEU|nr:hypothetical protein [Amycolatopsis taiwanensis]GLY64476.1 hypothetical protein Atai01_10950 [Amycolatopsis taiwanensis]